MLQNAWYSVISPEGCAAILWKTANEQTNNAAAIALKLTARDNIERWLTAQVLELKAQDPGTLTRTRYERFRKLGSFSEVEPAMA